jgi:hypothetical protein
MLRRRVRVVVGVVEAINLAKRLALTRRILGYGLLICFLWKYLFWDLVGTFCVYYMNW